MTTTTFTCVFCEETLVFCAETRHLMSSALFDWVGVRGVPRGRACSVACHDAFRVRQALQDPGSVPTRIRIRPGSPTQRWMYNGVVYRNQLEYKMPRREADTMLQCFPHIFEEI